jgi:ubiquinone/menaquinone biosynthesis C-methylase UbiE
MFRKTKPGTASRLTIVDHTETYGRHILNKISASINISHCLDLGFGNGDDLRTIKKHNPNAILTGIDCLHNTQTFEDINTVLLNIEKDPLPLNNESTDFIIANQIIEHVKEIYWINHEIFRTLKVGGHAFIGVPNVLSLHNRILGLIGYHPTCAKLISAHIRVFSKKDTFLFYNEIGNSFCKIKKFYGSQFYPFPKVIARFLANILPSHAVSNFYLIEKTAPYNNEFLDYRLKTPVQTNFYLGETMGRSRTESPTL